MDAIDFEVYFVKFLDDEIGGNKKFADRAMYQFIGLRIAMVISSASLPALTTLADRNWAITIAILIATLTGVDSQFRWGEEWKHFRTTELLLRRMKREYESRKSALRAGRSVENVSTLAENFEKLNRDVESFLQLQNDSFFKFRISDWRSREKAV
jgi:hypothetical protein